MHRPSFFPFFRPLLLIAGLVLGCSSLDSRDYTLIGDGGPLKPVSKPAEESDTQSLNGTWQFRLQPAGGGSLEEAQFYEPKYSVAGWQQIAVPSHWELQGHEEPGRREPKRVSDVAASAGLYRRNFSIPPAWQGRRIFLEFEGVLWGYQVWVNGRQVGHGDSAYTVSSFDITPHVKAGAEHVLAVRVTKLSPEMPFDADDTWALSGIFRDVRLKARPPLHLTEVNATTEVRRGKAWVNVEAGIRRYAEKGSFEGCSAACEVIDAEGRIVAQGPLVWSMETGSVASSFERSGSARLRIDRPRLWTSETPNLYQLRLTVSQDGKPADIRSEWIGLREVMVEREGLLLNGRRVTLRTIDWHGLHPESGRAMTAGQMQADIRLMKTANANTVRVVDHPPDPEFLSFCDRMGLYVICPVPIGGMAQSAVAEPYAAAIRDRVDATVQMAQLHPSVILWTIGGEPAWTPTVETAARRLKQTDPGRPLMIARAIPQERDADMAFLREPALADVISVPYPSTDAMSLVATRCPRPLFFTSEDNRARPKLEERMRRWETIKARRDLAGGSIGALADLELKQMVVSLKPEAAPEAAVATGSVTRYQGLMTADRQARDDYWATRVAYSPIQVREGEIRTKPGRRKLRFTVSNRYDYLNLSELTLQYGVQVGERKPDRDRTTIRLEPGREGRFSVRVEVPEMGRRDEASLALQFVDPAGEVIYTRNVRLRDARE